MEEEEGLNLRGEERMLLKFDMSGEGIHAIKHLMENIKSVIHSLNSVVVCHKSVKPW